VGERDAVKATLKSSGLRLSSVCELLGLSLRRMYGEYKPKGGGSSRATRPGSERFPERMNAIGTLALSYPWWGYKRLAVIARRDGWQVSDRQVYKALNQLDLLNKIRRPKGEIYQAARPFKLLPDGPNKLF
jgi:hypothetical protein